MVTNQSKLGDPPSGMSVVVKCDNCDRIAWVDYEPSTRRPYEWITNCKCSCGMIWQTLTVPATDKIPGSIDWRGYHRIPRKDYEHLL